MTPVYSVHSVDLNELNEDDDYESIVFCSVCVVKKVHVRYLIA